MAYVSLYTALIAVGIGQTIVFAVLAPLGRDLGLAEVQVGAIISASSLVFFLASPIWGRVSDRWGRKPVMLVGLVGYTLGTLLFASLFSVGYAGLLAGIPLWLALIVARMLQSSVMSATPPASSAWMADMTTPAERTAGMGRIGAANNVGAVVGPALGGTLAAAFGLLMPLWFAAGITLVAAAGIAWWLPRVGSGRSQTGTPPRLRITDSRILPFMLVGFFMFMGFAVVQQTIAFRMQDVLELTGQETARMVGMSMMFSAAMSLLAQGVVVQRMNVTPLPLLRAGVIILIAAFLLLAAARQPSLFVIAMGVMGFGMGLAAPGFTAGGSLAVTADEQGSVAGLTASVPALGFTVGPLLGTALYQWLPGAPYLLTAALFVPLMLYTWRIRLKRSPTEL